MEHGRLWRDLASALAELPEAQRVAFQLHAIEGMKHEEIARRLGISPDAAMQRYSRACRHLRERLPGWGEP
jgi:RNA polymerase sigma factor (sigma-70 family)